MTAETPDSENAPAAKPTPWWLWPHVLSLEAPLVAVLWQAALAHAHGIRLTPMLSVGLGLACWVVYLLDRTLDTYAVKNVAELDVRHQFYHRHRRVLLWGVIPLALVALGWLALWVIPEGVLWQAVGLALLVALYLASWSAQGSRIVRDVFVCCAGLGGIMLVSRMPLPSGSRLVLSLLVLGVMVLSFLRQLDVRMGHVLPKELTAALLFAMGCTTSTRFFAMPETIKEPVLECMLLALLFACNLQMISRHEAEEERGAGSASVTGRSREPLMLAGTLACFMTLLVLVSGGVVEQSLRGLLMIYAGCGVMTLNYLVYGWHRRVSADAYRVLADLALILPLPLVWMPECLAALRQYFHVA
ncbi:hypothetical protein [Prosthecobacter sp.]|uniref:hypothetical protein n=1 Tax=Prosthecobacter sp. TaxID=1965333 RepID=UPI00378434D9